MPIVVDINSIPSVFSSDTANHDEFKPVLDWIVKGNGKMVMGGTKFKQELAKISKYIRIILLLRDSNKVISGNDAEVDKWERIIDDLVEDTDFDDPHLGAIIAVTKCKLIATQDRRCIKHLKRNDLYPDGVKSPIFYTGSRNKDLLSDNYIDNIYKPTVSLSKTVSKELESKL